MNEGGDFGKLSSVPKCPMCGGELEKGYVRAVELESAAIDPRCS